ncbi:MAG: hypothetical protein AAFR21_16845 [Pseudomonadota bacterium]
MDSFLIILVACSLFVPYTEFIPMRRKPKQKGAAMGIEVNLHLGGRRVKADTFDISLDPNIIRLVKALARQAAEDDFNEAIKNNQH